MMIPRMIIGTTKIQDDDDSQDDNRYYKDPG